VIPSPLASCALSNSFSGTSTVIFRAEFMGLILPYSIPVSSMVAPRAEWQRAEEVLACPALFEGLHFEVYFPNGPPARATVAVAGLSGLNSSWKSIASPP
jgi:hypothetical protein